MLHALQYVQKKGLDTGVGWMAGDALNGKSHPPLYRIFNKQIAAANVAGQRNLET